jgi:hypothetical protein
VTRGKATHAKGIAQEGIPMLKFIFIEVSPFLISIIIISENLKKVNSFLKNNF